MKIDAHQDLLYSLSPYPVSETEEKNFLTAKNQTDLDKLKKSGLNLVFSALFAEQENKDNGAERFKKILSHHLDYLEENKNDFSLVKNKGDLSGLIQSNKIGILLHIEGLSGELDDIDYFFENGVRSIGLTYNQKNKFASGCSEASGGLTDLGEKIIKKCEDKKILIDLAHINEESFWDVLKIAEKPLIVSHSNCSAICPNSRNLKDEQIKILSESGGVAGIFFSNKFLNPIGTASMEDIIEHIKHISYLVGVDYVGIGSDFGGIISGAPSGMEDTGKLNFLEKSLMENGFNKEEITKIMGGNFYRILNQIMPV